MDFLIQPWFLILFAVVAFFVFRAIGARENDKAEVTVMTRWIIAGISVVIVACSVLKVLHDHVWRTF